MTRTIPKALVPVLGRPFIDHQLELLAANGAKQIVLCVSHLGEMIEAHIGDGRRFGLDVHYVFDGPQRVGTAGALARALPLLGDRFLSIYGDSYLPCDYKAVQATFEASGALGLMTVFENAGAFVPSNVLFRDGRIKRYDKTAPSADMQHVDYGLSAFDARAFDDVPPGEPADLAGIFDMLLKHEALAAYAVTTRFYEIGTPGGIVETEAMLTAARH